MALATRFGQNHISIRSQVPLNNEEIRAVAPSIFASEKHDSRSERYTYIPTIEVLEGLRREGFQPFMACQARCRDEGKREHTKHMLRLRHAGEGLLSGALSGKRNRSRAKLSAEGWSSRPTGLRKRAALLASSSRESI